MFYTHQQQMLLQASSFEKTFTGVMCCPAVGDDVDHDMMIARMMMIVGVVLFYRLAHHLDKCGV